MRPTFRCIAALVLAAALLGACSVSSDDASEDTTTENAGAVEAARGVTDDTIRLGVAVIDADAVREKFGVELGALPDEIFTGLEAAINADGGVNGRDVEFVVKRFLPVGTEPSEQVCRELIEDDEVFAVVGTFLGEAGLCVTETYATPYFGGFGLTPEIQERSKAPYLTGGPAEADSIKDSVQLLVDEGKLEDAKLAVYTQIGADGRFLEDNVLSVLEDGGVDVVSTATLSEWNGDQVAAGNEIDTFFQRFEADGADTVLNVVGLEVFAPALERTDWDPQVILMNGQIQGHNAAESFGMTNPDAELEGAIASVPGIDLDELVEDEQLLECLDDINANSDLDITVDDLYPPAERPGSRDFRYTGLFCSLFDFTVQVLRAAGDDPTADSILDGIDGLALDLPGNPDATLTRDRWGASASPRLWEFDAERGYFVPVD